MAICSRIISLAVLLLATQANAQIFPGYPFTFVPNTVISSSQVNANFSAIGNAVNANAAHSGINSDLNRLSALSISGFAPPALAFVATQTGLGYDGTNLCLVNSGVGVFCSASTTDVHTPGSVTATFGGPVVFNGSNNLIVSGMILFTTNSTCPSGWNAMDGTTSATNLAGYFPRFWGAHTTVDPNTSRVQGSGQNWAMVNHTHNYQIAQYSFSATIGGATAYTSNTAPTTTGGPNIAAGNIDVEERPINVALLGCQKQ